MAVYAIGDVQGCYQELLDLLDTINFDQTNDQLWFTGDLVNRGPNSLEVLHFVKALGTNAITVLGNHDLHLLAVAHDPANQHSKDTLDNILQAPDRNELLRWLRRQPLFHTDASLGYTLIHAGLPPQWDLQQTAELAHEVEQVLRSKNNHKFFEQMYGDQPDCWSDDLESWDRLRLITNALTRMRYCDEQGKLSLKEKGPPGTQPKRYHPWFTLRSRKTRNDKIIFGHWSTVHLGNIKNFKEFKVHPLDTGCLWGGTLTGLRLDDGHYFTVPSRQTKIHGD